MSTRNIITNEDKLLRKKSIKVVSFDEELKQELKDLEDTLNETEGVGIAGPQIGILKRIIVVKEAGQLFMLVNPIIIRSAGSQQYYEGCLSVENARAYVKRPYSIEVKANMQNGSKITLIVEGMLAIILCHEIDHLDGILYIDKAVNKKVDYYKTSEETKESRKNNPLVIINKKVLK